MRAIWLTVYSTLWLTSALTYCPDKCDCPWEKVDSLVINCSSKALTQIPTNMDERVEILDLSVNSIEEYNEERRFVKLKILNLSRNKLTIASFNEHFKEMEEVDLSYNLFTSLEAIKVQNLGKLIHLDLSHNPKIYSLGGLVSDSLTHLDLSNCKAKFFEPNFFQKLPKIKKLDISRNSLKKILNLNSPTLEELDISDGELKWFLENNLVGLPNLKKLNVSFNKGLSIPFQYKICFNLTEIDFSNTGMPDIDVSQFCRVEILNLSSNQIESLKNVTFIKNERLIFLNLSQNKISEIDLQTFSETSKIQTLDLSHNFIRDIRFTFYLPNVDRFLISHNQIKNLEEIMLKNAIELDLSYNNLFTVKVDFMKRTPKLKKLNLSYNSIEILKKIKSTSLTNLDLSYCQIISIENNSFELLVDLVELNLKGNKLVSLNYKLFPNKKLKSLQLSHNPWDCSCSKETFRQFYDFLQNRSLENLENLHCNRADESTWTFFCQKEWKEDTLGIASRKMFYGLLTAFVIVLLIIAVVTVCKYMKGQKLFATSREEEEEYNEDTHQFLGSGVHLPPIIIRSHSANDVIEREMFQRSARASTPPPKYEEAVLLPKLTENERAEALSLSSLDTRSRASDQHQFSTPD